LKPDIDWPSLLQRLEGDLSRRGRPEETPEPGWAEIARAIAFYAQVVLSRYPGLSHEDRDDLVQATLLKLQSRDTLQRLRAAGSPDGYVVVMLRNAAADLVRKRVREREGLERYYVEPPLLEVIAEEEQIKAARLRAALLSLSPQERTLLKMRYWRGMSIGEIATELGISYSAAAVRMFRILHRLREDMG
jgi:RNA polymerase sigma-70 factor (ECF subfamily)